MAHSNVIPIAGAKARHSAELDLNPVWRELAAVCARISVRAWEPKGSSERDGGSLELLAEGRR
ncbi:MAG: hypothetical protein ACYDB4_17825 [Candidatus Dormibacteraceae bacterium]